jgi:hypothetical protein
MSVSSSLPSPKIEIQETPYLRDTLLVLSSEKDGPCNATGVLALEEEGFGLAILESEDLAITTDVELALHTILSALHLLPRPILLLDVPGTPIVLATSPSRLEDIRTFPG